MRTRGEPAQQALAGVEAAVAAVQEQAARYAPADLQQVQVTLSGLKDKLARGDYKEVLAGVPQLNSSLDVLKEAVSERNAAAESAAAQWLALSAEGPKMPGAIQSRVEILDKSRKLPKNVSQDAFDAAKSGLESMKSTWEEASSAHASGDSVDAVAKANDVKQQGNELLQQLAMSAG